LMSTVKKQDSTVTHYYYLHDDSELDCLLV
jgi:hypothetical protein